MFERDAYPISQTGLDAWYYTINNLKNLFKMYNTKNNVQLNNYFNKLEIINNDLINGIKITYNTMFSPNVSLAMKRENSERMKLYFNSIIEKVKDIFQAVQYKKRLSLNEQIMGDIIFQFAWTLNSIAKSAIYGIDF